MLLLPAYFCFGTFFNFYKTSSRPQKLVDWGKMGCIKIGCTTFRAVIFSAALTFGILGKQR